MAKGSRPLPLPGLREPHHARPPTGQTGRPTLATLPPFGRPIGAYGHRLPHWPPLATPLGREPPPHWSPTGQKGTAIGGRPSHRPPLAIREATTGHKGRGPPSPGPPPDWPPTHPLPTPADSGLRTGGLPTPTYWPPTGLKAPLAIPALPHFPRLFGERWPPAGEGGFSRAKGADTMWPVCPIPPLGTPTPTDWPPTHPHRLTGHPFGAHYPHLPTDWPKGGGLATYGQKGGGSLSRC